LPKPRMSVSLLGLCACSRWSSKFYFR